MYPPSAERLNLTDASTTAMMKMILLFVGKLNRPVLTPDPTPCRDIVGIQIVPVACELFLKVDSPGH
jgi:hypothetical protein